MQTNLKIAIVGAGIGGLTLALALREHGIDAQLYEQTEVLREVGAAVALSANATRFYERMGLRAAFDAVCADIPKLVYRDGRSGAVIGHHRGDPDYRRQFGGAYWGVHRADLQARCVEGGRPRRHPSRPSADRSRAASRSRHAVVRQRCARRRRSRDRCGRRALDHAALDARLRRCAVFGVFGVSRRGAGRAAEPVARSRDAAVLDRAARAPAALSDRRRRRPEFPAGRAPSVTVAVARLGDAVGRGRATACVQGLASGGGADDHRRADQPALGLFHRPPLAGAAGA